MAAHASASHSPIDEAQLATFLCEFGLANGVIPGSGLIEELCGHSADDATLTRLSHIVSNRFTTLNALRHGFRATATDTDGISTLWERPASAEARR